MKKPQIFLIHFAGGNSYSFDFLKPLLTDFELIQLELPGRGKRIKEDFQTDLKTAVLDLYGQIYEQLNGEKVIIYGHSMGACLSLNIARKMEQNGLLPAFIFVTGNPGPPVDKTKRSALPDKEFVELLKEMGGIPEELLDNQEWLDFALPILRSDFELLESDEAWDNGPINIPIMAMMGDKEEEKDHITNWEQFTTADFSHEIVTGGHFFIYDHAQKLAAKIRNKYDQVVVLQS